MKPATLNLRAGLIAALSAVVIIPGGRAADAAQNKAEVTKRQSDPVVLSYVVRQVNTNQALPGNGLKWTEPPVPVEKRGLPSSPVNRMNQQFWDLQQGLGLTPKKIRAEHDFLPQEKRMAASGKSPSMKIEFPVYRNPNPMRYWDQRDEAMKRYFPHLSPT